MRAVMLLLLATGSAQPAPPVAPVDDIWYPSEELSERAEAEETLPAWTSADAASRTCALTAAGGDESVHPGDVVAGTNWTLRAVVAPLLLSACATAAPAQYWSSFNVRFGGYNASDADDDQQQSPAWQRARRNPYALGLMGNAQNLVRRNSAGVGGFGGVGVSVFVSVGGLVFSPLYAGTGASFVNFS